MISFSTFYNVFDSVPKTSAVTFHRFAQLFSQPSLSPEKQDNTALMWSPARWPVGSTRRLKAEVLDVSCLVLDFDHGTTLQEEATRWKDYAFLLHTSYRHTREAHRFRVILPLKEPVLLEDWDEVWAWGESVSPAADPKCRDAGHVYAMPRVSQEGLKWFFSGANPGPLLSPGKLRFPEVPEGMKRGYRRNAPYVPTSQEALDRRAAAVRMKAVLTYDGRATQIVCPRCGSASVWFHIEPGEMMTARCGHDQSCGSFFGLAALERGLFKRGLLG